MTNSYWQVYQVHWQSEPDDLEHGCDPSKAQAGTFTADLSANSLRDLVEDIFHWIEAPEVDWENVQLDACDEPGRIDIQVYESGPSGTPYRSQEVMPALREQAARRAAARLRNDPEPADWDYQMLSVWLTCYTVYVERHTVEDRVELTPYRTWPSTSGAVAAGEVTA